MAEAIGDVIHGGKILVREWVTNMYPYHPTERRAKLQAAVIAAARELCPWASEKLKAVFGQTNTDYHYYLTVTLTVPAFVREQAIRERLRAAEQARCACGGYGCWDDSISGTSGNRSCVWAGCPNCDGTAVGRPILQSDLDWYERRQGVVAR